MSSIEVDEHVDSVLSLGSTFSRHRGATLRGGSPSVSLLTGCFSLAQSAMPAAPVGQNPNAAHPPPGPHSAAPQRDRPSAVRAAGAALALRTGGFLSRQVNTGGRLRLRDPRLRSAVAPRPFLALRLFRSGSARSRG